MTEPNRPRSPRRLGPRRIGPAVLQLVQTLCADGDSVDIRLDARTAAAIARIDAREGTPAKLDDPTPWTRSRAASRSIA